MDGTFEKWLQRSNSLYNPSSSFSFAQMLCLLKWKAWVERKSNPRSHHLWWKKKKNSRGGLWLPHRGFIIAKILVQLPSTSTLNSQYVGGGQAPADGPILTKHMRDFKMNPKANLLLSMKEWSSELPVTGPWLEVLLLIDESTQD